MGIIKSEFKRQFNIIMLLAVIVLAFGINIMYGVVIKKNIFNIEMFQSRELVEDWRADNQAQLDKIQKQYDTLIKQEYDVNSPQVVDKNEEIMKLKYCIENDIKFYDTGAWDYVTFCFGIFGFVIALVIVLHFVFSFVIEGNNNMWKNLLTTGKSKLSIWITKIGVNMLYMLLYLFLFTAITYIFGGIIQGFNSNELDILVKNGTIITEEKYIWVIGYIFDVIVFLFLNLLIVSIASLFINSKNVLFVIGFIISNINFFSGIVLELKDRKVFNIFPYNFLAMSAKTISNYGTAFIYGIVLFIIGIVIFVRKDISKVQQA